MSWVRGFLKFDAASCLFLSIILQILRIYFMWNVTCLTEFCHYWCSQILSADKRHIISVEKIVNRLFAQLEKLSINKLQLNCWRCFVYFPIGWNLHPFHSKFQSETFHHQIKKNFFIFFRIHKFFSKLVNCFHACFEWKSGKNFEFFFEFSARKLGWAVEKNFINLMK